MKKGEKGQAIVIVLMLVAFGGMVIAPFLDRVGGSLIGSRFYGEAISQGYSTDAGVEHAIWGLNYGTLVAQIDASGDNTTSYQLGETINGIAPDIIGTRQDPEAYEITSIAGNCTAQAVVVVSGGNVTVSRWQTVP